MVLVTVNKTKYPKAALIHNSKRTFKISNSDFSPDLENKEI